MDDAITIQGWISIAVQILVAVIPIYLTKGYKDLRKGRLIYAIILGIVIIGGIIKVILDKGELDIYWALFYFGLLVVCIVMFIHFTYISKLNEAFRLDIERNRKTLDFYQKNISEIENDRDILRKDFEEEKNINEQLRDIHIQLTALEFCITKRDFDRQFQRISTVIVDAIFDILYYISLEKNITVVCFILREDFKFSVIADKHLNPKTKELLEKELLWGNQRKGIIGNCATEKAIIFYPDVSDEHNCPFWIRVNKRDKKEIRKGMWYAYPIINDIGVDTEKCIAVISVSSIKPNLFKQEELDNVMECFAHSIEQLIYLSEIERQISVLQVTRKKISKNVRRPRLAKIS